jgi:hypothetical protein
MHKVLSDALERVDTFPTGITLMGRTLAVDWQQHAEWMAQVSMSLGALRIMVAALESQASPQAAPQETTTETPACEHEPERVSVNYSTPLVVAAVCKRCKQNIRPIWVPAGSA